MNRALSGTYPPGSTFKVGIATAALSEHIITPTDTVYCSGTYKYYSDYQPKCWNIWGHGDLDVVHAIGTSCNCFFFEMGRLLTIDNINKYCTLYGFGQPTGIELTDVENTGVLADPDYARDHGLEWTAGRVIATAIGQGYNTFNPLQISCYMSMIVNRGTRYSAHLLGSVREFHTGNIIYKPDRSRSVRHGFGDIQRRYGGHGARRKQPHVNGIALSFGLSRKSRRKDRYRTGRRRLCRQLRFCGVCSF